MIAPPVRRGATFCHKPGHLVAIGLIVAALVMVPIPATAQERGIRVDVLSANCDHAPPADAGPILGEQGELPDYCEYAEGVTVTISDLNGTVLGTCTTSRGSCRLVLAVPVGTEAVVEIDESTVKPGYAPLRNHYDHLLVPIEGTDEVYVINVPDETTGLPNTGTGSGVEMGSGSPTPNAAGLLAVLAVLLGLGGVGLVAQHQCRGQQQRP